MDDEVLTSIGLAAKGFMRGDPLAILEMPVDLAVDLMHYTAFEQQFIETKLAMNQKDTK
jgi:hypothetical protein